MGFSTTEPMYYLIDFRGVKAGTPVKLKASNYDRIRMLASKRVVGTRADMKSPVVIESRIKAQQEAAAVSKPVVKEEPIVVEDTPVDSVVEPEPEKEEVSVQTEIKPRRSRKKKR